MVALFVSLSMSSKENYPVGYSATVVNTFKKRSAFEKGRFLIPHLKETDYLLDCGCGPGSITLDFASILKKGKVVGVDFEPSQIECAKQLMKEKKVSSAEFQIADILNLPYKNNSFDVAFTNGVLWTIGETLQVLEELKRVVKPGGIIACREPSFDGAQYYPESKIFEKAFHLQNRSLDALGNNRNVGKELSAYFSKVGLKDVQLSVSCDLYSSDEKRRLFADYWINAWNIAPWAKHIREKSWASLNEIKEFQQEFLAWGKKEGAFISAPWFEALGTVS